MFDQILSTVGSMAGGLLNVGMQRETNAANSKEAVQNRDFQDLMSRTAHQREVEDLKAAGLNPNLSAGGNGASTPSGSTATHQAPQLPIIDFPGIMIQSKALEQAQQKIDIDKANSAASIAKNLTEQELNKMKKILMQKGLIRAELEGEGYEWIKDGIKNLKKQWKTPHLPRFKSDPNNPDVNDEFMKGTQDMVNTLRGGRMR